MFYLWFYFCSVALVSEAQYGSINGRRIAVCRKNSVHGIAQTRDGHLWVATLDGLALGVSGHSQLFLS
jgi:hypothetical protein